MQTRVCPIITHTATLIVADLTAGDGKGEDVMHTPNRINNASEQQTLTHKVYRGFTHQSSCDVE